MDTAFKEGDFVYVNGGPSWTGVWNDVPAIVTGSFTTLISVRPLSPVPGWSSRIAHVPESSLSRLPLEELIREKFGDDYL